jgi:tetrahydromethanopterin S-methyltransferase subunit D
MKATIADLAAIAARFGIGVDFFINVILTSFGCTSTFHCETSHD